MPARSPLRIRGAWTAVRVTLIAILFLPAITSLFRAPGALATFAGAFAVLALSAAPALVVRGSRGRRPASAAVDPDGDRRRRDSGLDDLRDPARPDREDPA